MNTSLTNIKLLKETIIS